MKKILTIILSIALCCAAINTADFAGFIYCAAYAENVNGIITAENISLEYTEVFYDGTSRKPKVVVTVGGNVLSQGSDYTVRYPTDTVNVGIKKIKILGKGDYSGSVDAEYMVKQLYCGNAAQNVSVEVSDCYYNGLPQYPDVTVRYADSIIPKSEYTLSLSDNVEVSGKGSAVCVVKFRGNCSGERTEKFKILKAKPDDLEVDLVAKAGQSFSIDLSAMKPAGAIFGNLLFIKSDFSADGQPKIAFNVLNFTLNPNLKRTTMVGIPLTNIRNSEDYWLEFYIELVDEDIPTLDIKPIVKEYDGEPVSAQELSQNGSAAMVDGSAISGEWRFTTAVPEKPVDKVYAVAEFIPDDERYSYVYGIVPITVKRKELSGLQLTAERYKLNVGEKLEILAEGVPDDFDGMFSASVNTGEILEITGCEESENGLMYSLKIPDDEGVYTVKAVFGASALYADCTTELKITVGDPEVQENIRTTASQLSDMIDAAQSGSVVRVNRMTDISEELLKKAAEKNLSIEDTTAGGIVIVVVPAEMKSFSDIKIAVTTASIPDVLIERLGDKEILSITSFIKSNSGIYLKTAVDYPLSAPFACLYLYSTSGELEHIRTVRISSGSVMMELPQSGKYLITSSSESHVKYDLDNDGKFTIKDVEVALDLLLSIVGQPSEGQTAVLDFDEDGKVTIKDIEWLLDYCLSI